MSIAELQLLDAPAPDPDQWERLETMARSLAAAVDAKGRYYPSHCEAVARLTVLIGRELGIRGQGIQRLRMAGLLHDVGKLHTPDTVLLKPGRLEAGEYEVIKQHAVNGYTLLQGLGLHDEARWVLHHHERADGRGYPTGLPGDGIPLAARILSVADAYECMTATRIYSPSQRPAWALGELRRHAGTQFDPAAVDALATILTAG